jgi:hypothetical protein
METGTAMARAMSHVMRGEHYKVDLINMSYGEHANWSSSGRIGELMSEVSLWKILFLFFVFLPKRRILNLSVRALSVIKFA